MTTEASTNVQQELPVGIIGDADQATLQLPPGMGSATPLAFSKDRYTGTLVLEPGDAFDFHTHPRQDEVIYVIDGAMEAWYEKERVHMRAGDALIAPRGTVHACFNTGEGPARLFIVLSPTLEDVGDGWEMEDVSDTEPWASLRD